MPRDRLQEPCNRCEAGQYRVSENLTVECRYCGGRGIVEASTIVLRVLRSRKAAYNNAAANSSVPDQTLYKWMLGLLDQAAGYKPSERNLDADGQLILGPRNKSDPSDPN